MRWTAAIDINIGASREPVVSADAASAFFAAAVHALSETPGVDDVRLGTDDAGRGRDGPTIEVLFEAPRRDEAERFADETLVDVALSAGLAALPDDAPPELGWSVGTSVDSAEAVEVLATGVVIRLASGAEAEALVRATRTQDLELEPSRSFVWSCERLPCKDERFVVSQAFVEFADHDGRQRWLAAEHHGSIVSLRDDATIELLALADATAEDLLDLLADMRIAGLTVPRWEIMSAPRRIDLDDELRRRLAPLRRG